MGVDLPAVITVDLRLNEPRYVKLPDIMKAKKKPLDVTSLEALGVSAGQYLKTAKTEPPAQRQKGVMVKDVAELVDVLKKRGLIYCRKYSSSVSTTAKHWIPPPPVPSPAQRPL